MQGTQIGVLRRVGVPARPAIAGARSDRAAVVRRLLRRIVGRWRVAPSVGRRRPHRGPLVPRSEALAVGLGCHRPR